MSPRGIAMPPGTLKIKQRIKTLMAVIVPSRSAIKTCAETYLATTVLSLEVTRCQTRVACALREDEIVRQKFSTKVGPSSMKRMVRTMVRMMFVRMVPMVPTLLIAIPLRLLSKVLEKLRKATRSCACRSGIPKYSPIRSRLNSPITVEIF